MTSNPCAGLLRVRSAEARQWQPLAPHFRAQLASVAASVRQVLPAVWATVRGRRLMMVHCLACRLLVMGRGTRKGHYNRQQPDIAKDLLPYARPLVSLARMAVLLNGGAR